jgi:hypothetical protein
MMYSRANHDQFVQEGYRHHGESGKKEREARRAKAKSASKRTETDKIDALSG